MTDDACSIDGYRSRLGTFKDTDAERSQVFAILIDRLEEAQNKCQEIAYDVESERNERRRLQQRVQELEALTNRRDFVLVLLDADADDYIFQERFLNRNEAGGKDAADELHCKVKDYLGEVGIDAANTDIMVRAYADLKGLQMACVKNGKLKDGAQSHRFAHGFNQRQALFDFIDVGAGKEAADNKIRECLDFHVGNWQCKHIVFGACHDSGYAPYLGRFAADPSICDRITLLQGTAIHPRISALGFQRTLKLESVFAPHRASTAAVLSPAAANASSARVFSNPATLSDRLGPILRNEAGKRVDKVLAIDSHPGYLSSLRQSKLCQWFYLRGRCEGCANNHFHPPLNAGQFDCLWYLARHGLCHKTRKDKNCDDPRCIYGHEAGYPKGSGRV